MYEVSAVAGESFEEAIKVALSAVLISPHFLYRPELAPSNTEKMYRLDDYQLASRLSYYLWATMPDEELFRLAKSKQLRKPAVLEQQVERMLGDPRASVAMESFLGQWLGYDSLGRTVFPDRRKFPEFDPVLNHAMKQETILAFQATLEDGEACWTYWIPVRHF